MSAKIFCPPGSKIRCRQFITAGSFTGIFSVSVYTMAGIVQTSTVPVTSLSAEGNVTVGAPVGWFVGGSFKIPDSATQDQSGCYAIVELWDGDPSTSSLIAVLGGGWAMRGQPIPITPDSYRPPASWDRLPWVQNHADAAAGSDWSYAPTTHDFGLVDSFCATLTCDATVASRVIIMEALDQTPEVYWQTSTSIGAAASGVLRFTFDSGRGLVNSSWASTPPMATGWMRPVPFGPQSRLRTAIAGLQAGDVLSDIKLTYRWTPRI